MGVDCQDSHQKFSYSVYLNLITTMEGESIPPHSEMEAGNMNPEAVPVKSMVGYSDEGPDGHHQAEMDQEPSFSNGNGNGANDEEPKEEPKTDSFDLFGSMISKMPAKSADEEKEKVKDEDDSNEEKKDSFDKMFDSVGATNDQNDGDEEKKDSTEDGDETKPEGEESTKDVSISEENEDSRREYSLPYDWKKLACRRGASSQGNKTWDIYIIAPCGKKLRSNPEIEKYLSENPDVEVDRDVTNTSKPSDLISSRNNADSEDKKPFESGDGTAATTIADNLDELEKDNEIDMVVEIKASDKILTDEKYYEEMKPEHREALEANLPSIESFYNKLQCTVCSKNVDPVIGSLKGVLRHPHMGTAQCRTCRQFYGDGDWPRTEDGDEYCRMCAQGGDILLCDKCPNAFCKKCLGRNLGGRALREITKSEEWSCLLCDPTPIQNPQAIYMKLYKSQDEIKDKRAKDREEARKNKKPKKEAVSKKEKDALVKSPKNFLEENISEAFKTLEVYQKALETERTRCIKSVKEGMSVDTSTSITRKLRKLYAVTQKNMDLLDRAIVESFVENFPTESTRIHMGRVAPAAPPPVKRGAAKKKKPVKGRGKVKIKPKKGKPAAKGRKKGVIELNGAPDYVEYDLPASAKKKRKSAYDDDAEVIDLSEE